MTKLCELGQRIWETHRTLILWLTLPLLTASVLCLFLSRPFTSRDVLLNLASDFLTIVVTIYEEDGMEVVAYLPTGTECIVIGEKWQPDSFTTEVKLYKVNCSDTIGFVSEDNVIFAQDEDQGS